VNLGPLSRKYDVSSDPPKSIFFRETIFQPIGGVGPWSFHTR